MNSLSLPRTVMCSALAASIAACGPESTAFAPDLRASRASTPEDGELPRYSEWSAPVHLGAVVNMTVADFDPVVSRDGLSLYFASGPGRGGEGGRDLWVAERASTSEPWGAPYNVGAVINTGAHESKPSLSVDGHRLYFASNRPGGLGGFDIYMAWRRDRKDNRGWEAPVNLGAGVNSGWEEESPAAIFEDDATGVANLYFASNRPGLGGFDIYGSMMLPDGNVGPAVLVGELSTPFIDRDPSVRRDGREIFITSNRAGTLGGTDIWVASRARTTDPWSAPVHLGEGINGPTRPPELEQANDGGASLSFDGTTLYFHAPFRPENVGFMFDIWMSTRTRITGRN